MLPFSAETLLSILEHYNRGIWPLQLVGLLLALAAAGLAFSGWRAAARAVAVLLAAMWIWVGVAFLGGALAPYHFAAPALAGVFVAQGVMLLFTLGLLGWHQLAWQRDATGWLALVVIAWAVAGQPALEALATGAGAAGLQYAGSAPTPTMLLTLGLLLLARPRPPLVLALIPALWALATAYLAWELALPMQYIPAALGIATFAVLLALRFRRE